MSRAILREVGQRFGPTESTAAGALEITDGGLDMVQDSEATEDTLPCTGTIDSSPGGWLLLRR